MTSYPGQRGAPRQKTLKIRNSNEHSLALLNASAELRYTAPMKTDSAARPIHPRVGIGHVHLKVADLDRALAFYRDILGFELTQRYGSQAAFLSAGGYHHHIGLNTWESPGGRPPAPGTTGLYHMAIVYPTRAELADALRQLIKAGIPLMFTQPLDLEGLSNEAC